MFKKIVVRAFCLAVSFSMVACGNQSFTKEQEKIFMEEYMAMATIPSEPDVLEKKMKGNLERLSKEEASNAIDGMLYAMYQKLPSLNKMTEGMKDVIAEQKKKNIDINNPKDINKIDNATLKTFANEVLDKHFVFIKDNGSYLVQPNMEYVLEKYELHMTDALKAMVTFSKEEYESPFYDDKNQKFDLDKVAKRIIILEDNLKKYAKTYYNESFLKSKEYYYQIYFGMNNELLVDSKKVALKETMEHYQKTIKEHPDSHLSKDISIFLEKLESTNNTMTDDIKVFLTELTRVQTIDVNKDNSSNTKEQAENNVKETIQ
ncbi:hypothetical protein SMD22_00255 (plasmid) [Brevibacillus halotolerans]|nr:hypothetical protein SMD22_00255 [Brevibacillus halotolerans]